MVGPTASGKSAVAMDIAGHRGGEIVSVDSMQVYRGMDIGTAKASSIMRHQVPHHLLDVSDPGDDLSVAEFQRMGRSVLADLSVQGKTPIICGGSGLHFRALVDPLDFPPNDAAVRAVLDALTSEEARRRLEDVDPTAADHVDLANPRRVVRALEIERITGLTPSQRAATAAAVAVRSYVPLVEFVAIGLDPGPELADRVEQRFDRMLAAGLLDEVKRIGSRLGRLASQAVGYKELLPVIAGEQDLAAGRAAAIRATMALAKRQRTFFRRDPRIQWITWDPDPTVRLRTVMDYLDGNPAWNL
ncbi:MAG: tRNA (adenosine(37)-N6)-dimethylallyltransferase MiaA [Actinomycetota bacterium]|nr:tRNA (adenosine(37)-N6)-dimethylallyltransferase MiaA [Actinomycetota bacterium]